MVIIKYRINENSGHTEFASLELAEAYKLENGINSDIETITETIEEINPVAPRILEHIDTAFTGYPIHKIDFRKHLKPNVHLNKDVSMNINGRPNYALYTYENVNIAKIRFAFEFDSYFFLSRRTEYLSYYNNDGTMTEEYLISDEYYNALTSVYHMKKSQEERIEARQNIIQMLKGKIQIFVLQQAQASSLEAMMPILNSVSMFFKEYDSSYNTWVQTGAGDFIELIQNDTKFSFLNAYVAENMSIRDYVLYCLNNAT